MLKLKTSKYGVKRAFCIACCPCHKFFSTVSENGFYLTSSARGGVFKPVISVSGCIFKDFSLKEQLEKSIVDDSNLLHKSNNQNQWMPLNGPDAMVQNGLLF